jgi:TP901 family phage tail tape measure protein
MNALNNLTFMISLIDKVSAPMGKVMKSIDMASKGFQDGAQKIGYGTAGLVGAAYSVNSLLEPTEEMQRALGEVKSLGVADDQLNRLRETALRFSTQYGESAADFVRSSYDIQSAIAGLKGDELPAFTKAAALMAKGTKASMGDASNFIGTMFGIFQKSADEIGRAKWVDQLVGQTSLAVNVFKTTGKGMADAFTAIGAAGQSNNIAMNEQIAILGRLQATMSGSEAGTKYRAFLDNVGKAQKTLNLQFNDAQGRMLPIVDILDRIKGKFGDIDTVAKSDLIKKAFGTEEAVALIKLLSLNIDALKGDIDSIGQVKGLEQVQAMADAMTDPWARMKTGVDAVSTSIGTKLLPILLPTIAAVNATTQSVFAWTDANPELSKWIGILTLGTFGFIGTLALFSIAAGYATIVSTGWGLAMTWIFNPIKNMATAIWAALPSIWAFTSALLANPITWWVIGIAAAVALVAAAIIYWKEWTAVVIDFGGRFLETIGAFALIDRALAAWDTLKVWWSSFKAWIDTLNPFALVGDGIGLVMTGLEALPVWWSSFKAWLDTLDPFALVGDGLGLMMAGFEALPLWWSSFKAWLGTLDPFALAGVGLGLVMAGFEAIPQWWSSFKAWIGTLDPFALVGDGLGLIVADLEAIPQWWSNFTAWVGTLDPFSILSASIGLLITGFEAVPQWWTNFSAWLASLAPFAILSAGLGLLVAGFEAIPQWWTNFTAWIASLNPFSALSSAVGWLVGQFDAIKQWWAGFKGWLSSLNPFAAIGNGISRVLSSISSIPGLKMPSIAAAVAPPAISPPPALNKGPADDRHRPGILKQIVNAQGNNKSVDVGGITVHNYGNKPVSGQRLADELAMAAG